MLNIGFVVPTGRQNFNPFRNQPLTALYLLTIIEKHFGGRVKSSLVDLRGEKENGDLSHVPENDVFLYSVATPDFDEISDIARRLRSIFPKAKHIAGGPHVNLFPDESRALFDAVVLGEGEESIIKAIDDISAQALKPVYSQGKPVDLDAYPHPSREYLPKSKAANTGLLDGEYLNSLGTEVVFSRGCPFDCHFCANKKLTFGPVRYRSPELIVEEIEYLKKEYRIEVLALKDDNCIPFNPRIAKSFLETIGKMGLKWRGQTRANGVDPGMVQLAWESGCTDIAIGIESVSPKALKLINKKIDLDEAKKYINLLNATGIGVRLNMIVGLPGEEDDIVKQTLDFLDEASPRSVLLCLLCPMPGSEIYQNPERFGVVLDETLNWAMYRNIFGRFDPKETPNMVFEYKETTPWGKGRSKQKILADYMKLQGILRERKLNF